MIPCLEFFFDNLFLNSQILAYFIDKRQESVTALLSGKEAMFES
jgi:hypothetical protein